MMRFNRFSIACAALVAIAGLWFPQSASAQNVVQTVVVKDAAFGTAVPFCQVTVSDGFACYAPVVTDANGKATFRTNGISTIQMRRPNYGAVTVSPGYCATTFPVTLNRLPVRPQNTALARTNVIAGQVLPLAQRVGLVRYLGRTSLRNIEFALSGVAAGTWLTCEVIIPATGATATPACASAAFVLGAAGAADFVVNLAGVPGTTQFDFYLLGTTVIALPAR